MKPEAQRIAIAKACGWTDIRPNAYYGPVGRHPEEQREGERDDLPDYLNDLNAMHEVFLTLPTGSHITFGRHLQEVCGEGLVGYVPSYPEDFAGLTRIAHATSAQRAEAFLKTLNLWKEET